LVAKIEMAFRLNNIPKGPIVPKNVNYELKNQQYRRRV